MADFNRNVMTITGPIQHRRGTSAALEASTYIPAAGEIVIATDTGEIRSGDGINTWSNLPSYDGTELADNLTTADTGKALDATQGKILNDRINDVAGRVEIVEDFDSIDCGEIAPANGDIRCTLHYEDVDSQELVFNAGLGFGHIGGISLSYEQVLDDLGLTASSDAETVAQKFAEAFSLSDGTDPYAYGEDFSIVQGTAVDASSNEHSILLVWQEDVAPSEGELYAVYSGRSNG